MNRAKMTSCILVALTAALPWAGVTAQTRMQQEQIRKLTEQNKAVPRIQARDFPQPPDFGKAPCMTFACMKPGTPEYEAHKKASDEQMKKSLENLSRFDPRNPPAGARPARRAASAKRSPAGAKDASPSGVTYGAATPVSADTMRAREQVTQAEPDPVERKPAPGAVSVQQRPTCVIQPVMTDAEINACR